MIGSPAKNKEGMGHLAPYGFSKTLVLGIMRAVINLKDQKYTLHDLFSIFFSLSNLLLIFPCQKNFKSANDDHGLKTISEIYHLSAVVE